VDQDHVIIIAVKRLFKSLATTLLTRINLKFLQCAPVSVNLFNE